jgi:type I restriction enzyme R subunit
MPETGELLRYAFKLANLTIDWTLRENVRAQLRVLVKRILRKYGYPPDKQERATQTVLEQAALLSAEWAGA